jgi:hypothetical protein
MDWETEPARHMLRANNARDETRHRSTKDRRRWCKGKPGVEHQLAVRLSAETRPLPGRPRCYRGEWWPEHWHCGHQRFCTVCGKVLQRGIEAECPAFTTEITWFPRRRNP